MFLIIVEIKHKCVIKLISNKYIVKYLIIENIHSIINI